MTSTPTAMVCCSACSVDIPAGEASGHQRRLHLGPALWTCVGCHFAAPAFPDALAHALLAGHGLTVRNTEAPQHVLSQLASGGQPQQVLGVTARWASPAPFPPLAPLPAAGGFPDTAAFADWPFGPDTRRKRRGRPKKIADYWKDPIFAPSKAKPLIADSKESPGLDEQSGKGTAAAVASESLATAVRAEESQKQDQSAPPELIKLSESPISEEADVSEYAEETESSAEKRESILTCCKCGQQMQVSTRHRGFRATRHVIRCHNLSPYTCSVCPFSRPRREKVVQHIRSGCCGEAATVTVPDQEEKEALVKEGLSICFPDLVVAWRGL